MNENRQYVQKSEIIDLINPQPHVPEKMCVYSNIKCNFLDDIPHRIGSVGAILQGQPIICGGYKSPNFCQDCFIIGQPSIKMNMLNKRTSASSVVLNQNTLWIVGGRDGEFDHLCSTEYVKLGQLPVQGPELPFKISSHCMVKYSDNAIYIIGGIQNGIISNKTWIVDPSNGFKMTLGPSLNTQRHGHSCGKMIANGKIILVVAGGSDVSSLNYLKSVEILDPSSGQGWISGTIRGFSG